MFLTKCVGLGVLARKMENIHSEANVLEDQVVLHHFAECAVVIEEDMIWHEIIDPIGSNNHFLDNNVDK